MVYDVFIPDFFKTILKKLKRKYPSVGEDVKLALGVLVTNPDLGMSLQGFGEVKKLRVPNSDIARGKSGGYRLIYFVDRNHGKVVPLLLYSKSRKADVTAKEIKALLLRLEQELKD